MRYNRHSSLYSSFGLMVAGVALIVLRGLLSLVPAVAGFVPDPPGTRYVNALLNFLIGMSVTVAFLLFFFLILQSLARIETDAIETRADLRTTQGEVHRVRDQIALILERERDLNRKSGLGPPQPPGEPPRR